MIEPVKPVVIIWIQANALKHWAEGTRMPNRDEIKFRPTELMGWFMINISYKTLVDLRAHLEELDNEANDLPF
jgi:hypothetical protein